MMCGVSSSSSKLPLSTWTRVTISREGRDGTLTVNDEEPITGRSPGPATELNLQMRLYVGGLPGRPYSSSGVTTGFVGAIQRVCTTSRAQLPQRKSAAGISNSTVVFVPLNNIHVKNDFGVCKGVDCSTISHIVYTMYYRPQYGWYSVNWSFIIVLCCI